MTARLSRPGRPKAREISRAWPARLRGDQRVLRQPSGQPLARAPGSRGPFARALAQWLLSRHIGTVEGCFRPTAVGDALHWQRANRTLSVEADCQRANQRCLSGLVADRLCGGRSSRPIRQIAGVQRLSLGRGAAAGTRALARIEPNRAARTQQRTGLRFAGGDRDPIVAGRRLAARLRPTSSRRSQLVSSEHLSDVEQRQHAEHTESRRCDAVDNLQRHLLRKGVTQVRGWHIPQATYRRSCPQPPTAGRCSVLPGRSSELAA